MSFSFVRFNFVHVCSFCNCFLGFMCCNLVALNPLKCIGVRQLHLKVFDAIQIWLDLDGKL